MGAAKSCPAYCQRLDFQVDQAAHFSDQIRKSVRLGFQLQFLRPALQLQLPTKASSKHFLQKDGKLFADCVTKTQAAAFLRLKHISSYFKTFKNQKLSRVMGCPCSFMNMKGQSYIIPAFQVCAWSSSWQHLQFVFSLDEQRKKSRSTLVSKVILKVHARY